MIKTIILCSFIFLCGCNAPQVVTKTQLVVPLISVDLFNCPSIKKFRDVKNITDKQVALAIIELYKNNKICKGNILAIQKILDDARAQADLGT